MRHLLPAKMCTFTLESTHFIFNKCPIYTHDSASVKFSTNSHETVYSDTDASISAAVKRSVVFDAALDPAVADILADTGSLHGIPAVASVSTVTSLPAIADVHSVTVVPANVGVLTLLASPSCWHCFWRPYTGALISCCSAVASVPAIAGASPAACIPAAVNVLF
jgi:hypothetical protein